MNTKIQVTRSPNKRTREVFTFTTCASVNGIVMTLDTYTKYRHNVESDEFVACETYTRTANVVSNSGPRFSGAGARSKEKVLERKSVPSDVEQSAKLQLMERIEFIN